MKLSELTVDITLSKRLIELIEVISESIETGTSEPLRHLSVQLERELTSYNPNIHKAVNDIAPWISASLSEEGCEEYRKAAENLLRFAEVNEQC